MKRILTAVSLAALALACTATSDASPEPRAARVQPAKVSPLSAVAKSSPHTRITVEGYLFFFPDQGEYVLASTMCESFPPQPCDTVVALGSVDPAQAARHLDQKPSDPSFAHTQWSSRMVKVSGLTDAKGLSVKTIH